jgi:hypothetical protein
MGFFDKFKKSQNIPKEKPKNNLIEKREKSKKESEKREKRNFYINFAKLLVSVGTLIVAIIGVWGFLNYLPGEVKIATPTSYGIIGGDIDPFPSDLFFLSIPVENTGGGSITITNLWLKMERINGNKPGEVIDFRLIGEMADVSESSFQQGYQTKFSLTLDPHSRTEKILVFQPEGFWDVSDPDYYFTFKGNEEYRVTYGYSRDSNDIADVYSFHPQFFYTVDDIDRTKSEGYWYVCFEVEESMIKS